MSDAYPTALFHLEHVIKLIHDCCAAEALYILPGALVFRILLSSLLSTQTRILPPQHALPLLTVFCEDTPQRKPFPEQPKKGKAKTGPRSREQALQGGAAGDGCFRPFKNITTTQFMNTVTLIRSQGPTRESLWVVEKDPS
jgi:hypothetical protein